MSGLKKVSYALLDASNSVAKKASKMRKNQSSSGKKSGGAANSGGWKKVDLEEIHLEGFEDGCAFELEELTDYNVEKTESGGYMLIGSEKQSENNADETNKSKKKKKRRKSKSQKETQEGDNRDTEEDTIDADIQDAVEEDATKSETEELQQNKPVLTGTDEIKNKRDKKNKSKKTTDAAKNMKKQVEITKAAEKVDVSKWTKFKLHPLLLESLALCGFSTPTLIQERTIYPAVIDNRDVVGAAPTGSGKTLAFGLPILSQLLYERDQPGYKKECKVLILTPTRELALQIHQHLEKMVRNREIGIVTLVGGMAIQKQKRLLSYAPEIVIGTPGRLWEMIDSNHDHFKLLHQTLRFLVIDEADRMLQTGSYPEVEQIFEVLRRNKKAKSALVDMSDDENEDENSDEADDDDDEEDIDASAFASGANVMMLDDVLKMQQQQDEQSDEAEKEEDEDEEKMQQKQTTPYRVRQTFLFSATLTIPEGGRFQTGKKKSQNRNALTVLESVMKRVGLRGKPAVVDLSIDESVDGKSTGTLSTDEAAKKLKKQQENVALSLPAGLELCQHEVTDSTRDSFLYYFLTQYPGRTIVFLNAIHQVRKLTALLTLLQLPVFALHAEMQQRQRLKKLDGFRAHKSGILIATDVAARGLDIPSVDYVVHYHVARSTEVFVHRSGRTARANKDGLSISLVAPVDAKYHQQICKLLQRPTGLADFPFDHRFLPAIDERMRLAKAINDMENASGKIASEETWFSQMAAAADLEIDDDLLFELDAKKRSKDQKQQKQHQGESVESLRGNLARLLAEPLRPIGSTRKFRQLYQDIGTHLSGDGEYRKRNASEDLATKTKKSYKRFRRR